MSCPKLISAVNTYSVKFHKLLLIFVSDAFKAVRVLKHIKLVNYVKLNWAKLCNIVGLLVLALGWLILSLHQLRKLFVSHRALPSSNLPIIKRDK